MQQLKWNATQPEAADGLTATQQCSRPRTGCHLTTHTGPHKCHNSACPTTWTATQPTHDTVNACALRQPLACILQVLSNHAVQKTQVLPRANTPNRPGLAGRKSCTKGTARCPASVVHSLPSPPSLHLAPQPPQDTVSTPSCNCHVAVQLARCHGCTHTHTHSLPLPYPFCLHTHTQPHREERVHTVSPASAADEGSCSEEVQKRCIAVAATP